MSFAATLETSEVPPPPPGEGPISKEQILFARWQQYADRVRAVLVANAAFLSTEQYVEITDVVDSQLRIVGAIVDRRRIPPVEIYERYLSDLENVSWLKS